MGRLVDSGVSERRRGSRPERTGRPGAWGGQPIASETKGGREEGGGRGKSLGTWRGVIARGGIARTRYGDSLALRQGRAGLEPGPGRLLPRSWRSTCCGPVVFGVKAPETSLIHCASKFTPLPNPVPSSAAGLGGRRTCCFFLSPFLSFLRRRRGLCV